MKTVEKTEIDWRNPTVGERFFLCSGIRKNNFRCTFRYFAVSILPCTAIAVFCLFIGLILTQIFVLFYLLSVIVFFLCLEGKCFRVFFGNIKCADAACYSRDDQYQYTTNGFSYYINVFRVSGSNDKRIFKLPAYKSTLFYSNSGDNMLVVRFSKNNIRCFSKKELNLTSHSPKSGSRSKLSKKEILSVLKAERKKLGEARIIFGIDFMAVAVFNIMIMINFFRLFSYSIALLIIIVFIDSLRIRKYTSRIKKLKTAHVSALKNAIVSCFLLKKPKLTGGVNFVYYLKIMHPESGRFRVEKLREFSWATVFDNEISDNIIVIDYGKKRRGKDMQHYIFEEY